MFPDPHALGPATAAWRSALGQLAPCRQAVLQQLWQADGLVAVARHAKRMGLPALACAAWLAQAELLFQDGEGAAALRLCASARRLARRSGQLAALAQARWVRALGLRALGQRLAAFQALAALLLDNRACRALPAVPYARLYLALADLCSSADADDAPLACIELAFSTLKARGSVVSAEFWWARCQQLLALHVRSDARWEGALPPVSIAAAPRQALLDAAAVAVREGLEAGDDPACPGLHQRLAALQAVVAAWQARSVDQLAQAWRTAKAARSSGGPGDRRGDRVADHWIACAALLLDAPALACTVLGPAEAPAMAVAPPGLGHGDGLLLRSALARALGDHGRAHALYIEFAQAWADAARRSPLDAQQVMKTLRALQVRAGIQPRPGGWPGFLEKAVLLWRSPEGLGLSFAEVAAQLGVPAPELRAAFRRHFGQPPRQVIAAWRLQRAHDIAVVDPQVPVAEIAGRAGFRHVSRFCAAFKARFRYSVAQLQRDPSTH